MDLKTAIIARLLSIEKRLEELEDAGAAMRYCGVYQRAQNYLRNSVVSCSGSAWVSIKDDPEGKPGQSGDWQLLCKRGADGKDGSNK